MLSRTQRLRDPVHGLIVFDKDDALARLAWKLINTQEFQRLRRIKQLGVSEFVFPGAVHTRFAHSIGVFHTARGLVRIIEREATTDRPFDQDRADVAIIAALLHDLGHGPFSHTFEEVQESHGIVKRHEEWTAEIIRNPEGEIRPLLEAYRGGMTEEVSALLAAEDPIDIYHAVVSSSFDADRLDYLQRDRLMTGTGAGAIDFDWLMQHVRVADIVIAAPEGDPLETKVATFCLDAKALPAAEQFLLSRYTLHEQVYLHKTTRCIEAMIGRLLKRLADVTEDPGTVASLTGLEPDHALLRYFARDGATIGNYLWLDDCVITGSLERMQRGQDPVIADLAGRLRERRLYKTLDIGRFGADAGRQRMVVRRLDGKFRDKIASGAVVKDESASFGIYTTIGGDEDKLHKKLHILDADRQIYEITKMSAIVENLASKRQFTRYYFADAEDRASAIDGS